MIEISVLCLCLVKLEEFFEGFTFEDKKFYLKYLIGVTYYKDFPLSDINTELVFALRNSLPFSNLSLKQEKFVYRTFLAAIL